MPWIVVDIGCLHCGRPSDIVGVFESMAAAHAIAYSLGRRFDWREGGQHDYQVFAMPEMNVVHEDYRAAMAGDSETKRPSLSDPAK